MIDEDTARAIATELDMPLDIVRQTLAEAEAKPGTTSPIALGKTWLRNRKKRETEAPRIATKPLDKFIGFDAQGSAFRSPVPVANAQTEFATWLVREIRDQLLSPADVVALGRRQPEAIWNAICIESALKPWAIHDHWTLNEHGTPVRCERPCDLSCWASLPASSGLAECIRSWGGWYPWANDRHEWEVLCARDYARRNAA